MKNWKHWTLVAIITFIGIIVGFTACDNDDGGADQPKNWSATSVDIFGGRTVTISGVGLTETEWNNAKTAIANKINTSYSELSADMYKDMYKDIFDYGLIITIEKNPTGYIVWKTPGGIDLKLFVNVDKINSLDVFAAISAVAVGTEANG